MLRTRIKYHEENRKTYIGIVAFVFILALATLWLNSHMEELLNRNICNGLSKGVFAQAEMMEVKLDSELDMLGTVAKHMTTTGEAWEESVAEGDVKYMQDVFVREGILDARGEALYGADLRLSDHSGIIDSMNGIKAVCYNKRTGVLFTAPVFLDDEVRYIIYRRIDKGGVDAYFRLRDNELAGEGAMISRDGSLMFSARNNGIIKEHWLDSELMSVYKDLLNDLHTVKSSARRFVLNGVPMYASVCGVRNNSFILFCVIPADEAVAGMTDISALLLGVFALLAVLFIVGIYFLLIEEESKYALEKDRTESVWRMSMQTVKTLARAIDAKDSYTNGHSSRVAKYSVMLGKRLGFDEERLARLQYVALLHDVGKIGIADSILNKKGKLTDEEYAIIKSHSTIGARILSDITEIPDVAVGAKYHHERFDGKGYPVGLKGEEIPFIARIIAVADSYDAMTSQRSYRSALPQGVVREEIERCSGTQFDPRVARLMLEIIDEDRNYELRDHTGEDVANG